MDSRVRSINRELKWYDKRLSARRASNGVIQIYRESVRYEAFYWDNGKTLFYPRPNPYFILSLTDNWTLNGQPAEWGIEPLMSRIREIDCQRDDQFFSRLEAEEKRIDELKERARKNENKALAADMRKDFAKATNDINTSSLVKLDSRRKKDGYL